MNSITQDLMFRQSVVKYSLKYGVTRASIQYRVNRRTIYRWREKYDGTIESFETIRVEKSKRKVLRVCSSVEVVNHKRYFNNRYF